MKWWLWTGDEWWSVPPSANQGGRASYLIGNRADLLVLPIDTNLYLKVKFPALVLIIGDGTWNKECCIKHTFLLINFGTVIGDCLKIFSDGSSNIDLLLLIIVKFSNHRYLAEIIHMAKYGLIVYCVFEISSHIETVFFFMLFFQTGDSSEMVLQ